MPRCDARWTHSSHLRESVGDGVRIQQANVIFQARHRPNAKGRQRKSLLLGWCVTCMQGLERGGGGEFIKIYIEDPTETVNISLESELALISFAP